MFTRLLCTHIPPHAFHARPSHNRNSGAEGFRIVHTQTIDKVGASHAVKLGRQNIIAALQRPPQHYNVRLSFNYLLPRTNPHAEPLA